VQAPADRYNPAVPSRPASQGHAVDGSEAHEAATTCGGKTPPYRLLESEMPKLKTKSGAKKRFKVSATGKVIYAQRGKQHGMIKRTNKQIRNLRGTRVLFKSDGETIKRHFLPYA
jgi:large subunit ribosomal protein L35